MLLPDGFAAHPSVFAVNDTYHIMLPTATEALVSVRVGNEEYFDDTNGICRTSRPLHCVIVPQAALDETREYTIRFRKVIERKPYFSETEDILEYPYTFVPVEKTENIRLYQLADVHNHVQAAITSAAQLPERPDILLLNGDIAEHSGSLSDLLTVYRIAGAITEGGYPCVFARGNHDLRGACAEQLADYSPTDNGRSYYTFRLGPVWGVILDCGEDKPDHHAEYGHTVCCHAFRKRETAFLKTLSGYDAPGVQYRLVISHVPFCYTPDAPFDIEIPLFTEWADILRETVKPHLALAGHVHTFRVVCTGEEWDDKGQPCPTVIAGRPCSVNGDKTGCTGALLTLSAHGAEVYNLDEQGQTDFRDHIITTADTLEPDLFWGNDGSAALKYS